MAHARLADQLVLHGSPAAGLFRDGRQGSPVCVTATLYDGLVLARSARNHSMNYRSVCLHGDAVAVIDPDQIIAGLRALVDHVIPGRWDQVRKPTSAELRETALWQVAITEASVKIRSGSTLEPESDGAIPVWAGHIPAQLTYGQPIRADRLARHLELPDFVSRLPGVVRHDIQVDPR